MRALTFLGIFLFSVGSEAIWVLWSRGVERGRPIIVSGCAGLLVATGLWTVVSVISDRWGYVPAVIGAMIGALVGMKLPVKPSES